MPHLPDLDLPVREVDEREVVRDEIRATQAARIIKRLSATRVPADLAAFKALVQDRLPERHLLDVLKHAEYLANTYTRL